MKPEDYMRLALDVGKNSGSDIPIGCIIVKKGEILAKAHNNKEANFNPTAHAEIEALRIAGDKLKEWRLIDCEMYVTLEPCPMCAWGILNSHIEKIYFGAYDSLYGAFGSKINLLNLSNRKPFICGGILEAECKKVLDDYFKKIRK